MPDVTIRNLPADTHRALQARAAEHGRSTEAEIRDILEQAVKPTGRIKLGSHLAAIGRDVGLTNEEVKAFREQRNPKPPAPMTFE